MLAFNTHVKKVLALVMAFAMVFTMMATAGAAYTDQADIEATEAVEMLNAIGVMTGDPDGSFRPNDTITRAEACRMIYTIRTNSDNADAYKNMQTTFKDVPSDAWYAGYVKHCQAANIVSGTSATTFEPNRDVTGVELALMCLRVMGYDPEKADIGGSTWSTKTIGLATEAGILDGVNTTITSACPRQWAAQIMYNTIDARTVRWSNDSETYTDLNMGGGKMDKVGKQYMKLYSDIGTLTAIDGDNLTINATVSDAEDSDNSTVGDHSFTKLGQDYSSLLGQKVKVLYRDNKVNDVVGVYALGDNTSYSVAIKDIEKDGDKVKFDGKSYGFDDGSKISVVTLDATNEKVVTGSTMTAADFDTTANKTATKTVNFVDNDGDGKFNIAIITEYLAKEVTYVGSDRITAGTTYKMEDENIADDIAKDDWAMISYNMYDECLDIAKAEVVVDQLASSKDKTDYKQYEIGGTWYNIKNDEADKVSVGDTVKAYIVAGVIVKIDTDDGTGAMPSNIAVVVGNSTGSTTTVYGDQVKLRFFDGTVKTVTVDSNGVKGSETKLGQAYKISGSDSNTKLEKLETNKKYNGYEFISKQAVYSGTGEAVSNAAGTNVANTKLDKISNVKVDDNASIILVDDKGNSKKITGKQFKAIAADDAKLDTPANGSFAAFTKDVNGLERVMMASVRVKNTNISGVSYDNYGYVVGDAVNKSNGDVEFRMWNGSENLTVKVENASASDYVKGTLVAYASVNENSYLQDAEAFGTMKAINTAGTSGKNGAYAGSNLADSAKSISINDSVLTNGSLDVTADTHVLLVDSDADGDNIGQPYKYGDTKLTTAAKVDSTYKINVVYRVENGATPTDGADLDLLVVDVTGAFDFNRPESTVTPPVTNDGKTYATADELNNALKSGNVTATGVIPAGNYISSNTLTLKNAVVTGAVNVVGSAVIDGSVTKLSGGSVEIANGAVTFKNGAKVGDVTLTNVTSITDENASTTDADIDAMLAKTSTVTVKDASDALTVDAADKTLNLANAKAGLTVTAAKAVNVSGAVTGDLSVTKGDVKVAGAVSGKVVAGTNTVTVASIGDYNQSTSSAGGKIVVTGDVSNATLPAGMAGTTVFEGTVTQLTLNAASVVEIKKAVDMTKVTATAGAKLTLGAAPSAITGSDTNANGVFVHQTAGASFEIVDNASKVKTAKQYVYTADASIDSGNTLNTAQNAWFADVQ